jgi:HK97 family phage major capsid protein
VVGSSADCTDLFVGDFSQLMCGLRTNFSLQLSEHASDATGSAFNNLQVWIRCFMRVDFQTMRDDAFQVVSGIRPPA